MPAENIFITFLGPWTSTKCFHIDKICYTDGIVSPPNISCDVQPWLCKAWFLVCIQISQRRFLANSDYGENDKADCVQTPKRQRCWNELILKWTVHKRWNLHMEFIYWVSLVVVTKVVNRYFDFWCFHHDSGFLWTLCNWLCIPAEFLYLCFQIWLICNEYVAIC